MAENATERFYNRISQAYDLLADPGEHRARELGLQQLEVQPGESVLEIGYGTGHSLVALAKSVGESGRVVGVDISSGMRDVSRERLVSAGLDQRVDLRVESVPPLSLPDDSMDVVAMSFTLELFPLDSIPEVLAECRRVLKPEGRLGVVSMATVADGERESLLEKTYIWMHQHFPHIVDCQPIPAERMIQDAGFQLVQQQRIDLFTMPVAIVVAKHSR